MTQKKLSQFEKIKYVLPKLKNINSQIKKYYALNHKIYPLFRALSSHIFINFRANLDSNAHAPLRIKNKSSMETKLKKLENELMSSILKSDCTEELIDEKLNKMLDKILQDIFGLTIVLHTNNNIEKTFKYSPDPEIQMLLEQSKTVKQYLDFSSSDAKNLSPTFDITPTFIDNSDIGIQNRAPKELPPLKINNIKTWEDYYTSLISLLTLLTNLSTPCNYSSDGKKHNYCVSQINFPYLKILGFKGVVNPNDKLQTIKNLVHIAENSYDGSFISFDEQLDFALKNQKDSKQNVSYYNKIDTQLLLNCKTKLQYLKENLESLINDRLSQYVLEHEVPKILESMSKELKSVGLDFEEVSSYNKARYNGYVSSFIITKFEKKIPFEIQLTTEFRSKMGEGGNGAHNASRFNKAIGITNLFTSCNPSLSEDDFNILLKFLNTIEYNDIDTHRSKPEDDYYKKILEDLIEYAKKQIKVADYVQITDANGEIKKELVTDYIASLLQNRTPIQGRISAAHNKVSNEARFTLDDDIHLLQKLLPERYNSVLSQLLIDEFQDREQINYRTEKASVIFSHHRFIKDLIPPLQALSNELNGIIINITNQSKKENRYVNLSNLFPDIVRKIDLLKTVSIPHLDYLNKKDISR